MPTPMPTHDEILTIVQGRVPDYSPAKQEEVATTTLAILAEPRYEKMKDTPLAAVKLAVARLNR